MTATRDILGLGVVTVDDFLYVPEYPRADTKTAVSARERQCGGLTGTALIAAARLGATCAYAGVLGDDDLASFVAAAMTREGVDLTHAVRRGGVRTVYSVIVVDAARKTRTAFCDVTGSAGADDVLPADEVIRSSRVLLVDGHGVTGMIRASKIARAAGVSIVADFEHGDAASPHFAELFALVDHLILPLAYARERTGRKRPADVVRGLWHEGVDTACVTCGTRGACYVTKDDPEAVTHQPAFAVETVDTTGCGDVFHGAYAFALARGMKVHERMRLAAASAAIKATQPGGQKGIPRLPEVEKFLAAHPD